MRHLKFVVNCALVFSSIGAFAQDSARTVQYHSQDIIPIRAKLKYTTLIELPTTEKIMEAATGDKDFWIVDVVGNFCFVHPAKPGISSNLNLITDKGNIYSFTSSCVLESHCSADVLRRLSMRIVALSLLFLSILTLAGCQSKAEKIKKLQDQYNAEYPAYAKACLEEDSAAAKRLMTGEKLTAEQTAAIEAEQKAREARCKPESDRLAQIQREILAAQQ